MQAGTTALSWELVLDVNKHQLIKVIRHLLGWLMPEKLFIKNNGMKLRKEYLG